MKKRIAIIGCGNMGEALLKGLVSKGLFKKASIIICEARSTRRAQIKRLYHVKVTSSNAEAIKKSNILILAVKPQDILTLLKDIGPFIKDKLVISIAAGIKTGLIRENTKAVRIIRAMPNTPALVGCGITAISAAKGAKASDIRTAKAIFSRVGEVVILKERNINAVTAVSGSGPAYFFLLMESLAKAAASLGIKGPVAEKLVSETALGAARLQHINNADPSILREKVTSKGGTTEAALKVLRRKGFERMMTEAVRAAAKRAKQLSK